MSNADLKQFDVNRCPACGALLRRGQDVTLEDIRGREVTVRLACPACGAVFAAVFAVARMERTE